MLLKHANLLEPRNAAQAFSTSATPSSTRATAAAAFDHATMPDALVAVPMMAVMSRGSTPRLSVPRCCLDRGGELRRARLARVRNRTVGTLRARCQRPAILDETLHFHAAGVDELDFALQSCCCLRLTARMAQPLAEAQADEDPEMREARRQCGGSAYPFVGPNAPDIRAIATDFTNRQLLSGGPSAQVRSGHVATCCSGHETTRMLDWLAGPTPGALEARSMCLCGSDLPMLGSWGPKFTKLSTVLKHLVRGKQGARARPLCRRLIAEPIHPPPAAAAAPVSCSPHATQSSLLVLLYALAVS